MSNFRAALALIGCVVLFGCAPTIWVKPGATQADYNRDSYGCEKDARQSGYFGGGLIGAVNMEQFEERCMVAHGWAKERQASR